VCICVVLGRGGAADEQSRAAGSPAFGPCRRRVISTSTSTLVFLPGRVTIRIRWELCNRGHRLSVITVMTTLLRKFIPPAPSHHNAIFWNKIVGSFANRTKDSGRALASRNVQAFGNRSDAMERGNTSSFARQLRFRHFLACSLFRIDGRRSLRHVERVAKP